MAEYIEREKTVELLRSLGNREYRKENGTIQEAIKMISYPEYTPCCGREGKGGDYRGGIGRESAIRRMHLCCVYVTIQREAQKGKRKFPRPW